jgi:conjugal transfer pilus assembly protein TraB
MKLWQKISPKNRRLVVIGAAVAAFSTVVAMLPEGEERERNVKEEPAVHAILTDRDNSGARFERLMAQLENMRSDNAELTKEIERMRRDMERLEAGEIGPSLTRELQVMQEKISQMERNAELGLPLDSSDKEGHVVIGGKDKPADDKSPDATPPVIKEPSAPTQVQMWDQPAPAPVPTEQPRGKKGEETVATQTAIRVIEAPKPEVSAEEAEAKKADEGIYIPAGAIVTGTLITGLDAPTGKQARQEPHPALLRIKHEAILPNRFRADVRECFALLGGYGDLSSERAYLRGETISCVRKDGKVVESSLESFTVGEDGKAGVRGRLVSKQGQMLNKALTAGVIEGFAEAFDRVPVPTLSLEGTEQQLYQQAFSQDAMQSGAVAGIGKALDRLAQFYIDQAEGMFPVIEIDAGREVEIVLIRGGKLALK